MQSKAKTPWATLAAIVLNLAVAFAAAFSPGLGETLAFDPVTPKLGQAFACIFAHANLVHLLGNLVFLAAVGPLVEFVGGGWRLGLVYLASGLAGVLAHVAMVRFGSPSTPLLGASSAVAGCVGYASVRYLRTKVPVLPKFGVPVAALCLTWLAIQVAGSFLAIGGEVAGGAAYWSHVAGFLAGLGLAFALGGALQARIEYGHEVLEKMNARGPAAALLSADEHLRDHPEDLKAWAQKAKAHEDLDETDQAAAALVRLLALQPVTDQPTTVSQLDSLEKLAFVPSVDRMRMADRLKDTDLDCATTLLKSVADDHGDVRCPEALLSLADVLAKVDPPASQGFAQQLAESFPVHAATDIARKKGLVP